MQSYLRKNRQDVKAIGLLVVLTVMFVYQIGVLAAAETVTLPAQVVAPGEVKLTVKLELPPGHKLNPEAPSTVNIVSGEKKIVGLDEKYAQNLAVANFPLSLTVPVTEGKTTLQATFHLNYCDDKIGLCFFRDAVVTLPVEVNKNATKKQLEMVYQVKTK